MENQLHLKMSFNQKIIAIIPAFNESKTVGEIVAEIKFYADETIVIDDGSTDNTFFSAKDAGAIVIRNQSNQGYEASIEKGFREALKRKASIVFTFDADGQHRPEDIEKLTKLIISGKADVVIGQRQKIVHFAEKFFSFYTNIRFGIKDPLCGLKAYKIKVYSAVGHFDTLNLVGTQLMIEAIHKGFKINFITINTKKRIDASRFYFRRIKANYNILKAAIKAIIFLS